MLVECVEFKQHDNLYSWQPNESMCVDVYERWEPSPCGTGYVLETYRIFLVAWNHDSNYVKDMYYPSAWHACWAAVRTAVGMHPFRELMGKDMLNQLEFIVWENQQRLRGKGEKPMLWSRRQESLGSGALKMKLFNHDMKQFDKSILGIISDSAGVFTDRVTATEIAR